MPKGTVVWLRKRTNHQHPSKRPCLKTFRIPLICKTVFRPSKSFDHHWHVLAICEEGTAIQGQNGGNSIPSSSRVFPGDKNNLILNNISPVSLWTSQIYYRVCIIILKEFIRFVYDTPPSKWGQRREADR